MFIFYLISGMNIFAVEAILKNKRLFGSFNYEIC
jgi:hypothetical protein